MHNACCLHPADPSFNHAALHWHWPLDLPCPLKALDPCCRVKEDGTKVRYFRKTGEELPTSKDVKPSKQ